MKKASDSRRNAFLFAVLALAQTGCDTKEEPQNNNTDLKGTVVITIDNGKTKIVKPYSFGEHKYYIELTSDVCFIDSTYENIEFPKDIEDKPLTKVTILNEESITNFLTGNEIISLKNDNLTEEEIDKIIMRIYNGELANETSITEQPTGINSQENFVESTEPTTYKTLPILQENDIPEQQVEYANDVFENGLLDYCKNYSLFEPIELDDETNKKIDELIKELKDNDVDITDLDNQIIRQYFLGPYLHSNEKRYIIDNDYGKSIYFYFYGPKKQQYRFGILFDDFETCNSLELLQVQYEPSEQNSESNESRTYISSHITFADNQKNRCYNEVAEISYLTSDREYWIAGHYQDIGIGNDNESIYSDNANSDTKKQVFNILKSYLDAMITGEFDIKIIVQEHKEEFSNIFGEQFVNFYSEKFGHPYTK